MEALLVLLFTCFLATTVDAAVKCHVCNSASATDATCTNADLGDETDGCESCAAYKLDVRRFTRECRSVYHEDDCEVVQSGPRIGQILCTCNTALCNANVTFKSAIRCHVCVATTDTDTHCADDDLGDVTEKCLTCRVSKRAGGRFDRSCLNRHKGDTCWLNDGGDQFCRCNTDLCNDMHLIQPTLKCYFCVPESENDHRCNARNSGRIIDGCLACSTSVYGAGITTRHCLYYAKRATSTYTKYGSTISECNADLCNGGDDKVDVNRSRGVRETVSRRLLIGGVMTAVLGLALSYRDRIN